MTLADIMKVTGKRLESSIPPGTREPADPTPSGTETYLSQWEPEVCSRPPSGTGHARTTFLYKWDRDVGEKVGTFRPSIHHFCTHPSKPQLPAPLLVLSRATHTMPGAVRVRSSQDTSVMEVNIVTPKVRGERSLMTVGGSTKCTTSPVSFTTLASNKRKLSNSRHGGVRGSFMSSSEILNKDEIESGDIVSLAKARLRREKMAKEEHATTPDGKKLPGDESVQVTREGVRSRGGQRSREGASRGGQRSKAEKLEGGSEDEMHLSGTRMEVIDNPGRYVHTFCIHYHVTILLLPCSLLWAPAAPKLYLFPATIQSYLFPQYESPQRLLSVIKEEAKEMESGNLKLGGK